MQQCTSLWKQLLVGKAHVMFWYFALVISQIMKQNHTGPLGPIQPSQRLLNLISLSFSFIFPPSPTHPQKHKTSNHQCHTLPHLLPTQAIQAALLGISNKGFHHFFLLQEIVLLFLAPDTK